MHLLALLMPPTGLLVMIKLPISPLLLADNLVLKQSETISCQMKDSTCHEILVD